MNDSISRQAVLALYKKYQPYMAVSTFEFGEELKNLPSAEPEINRMALVNAITTGIIATDGNDIYSCGMRNGMRWCKSLLSDEEPKYEDASQYAEPERKTGIWIPGKEKGRTMISDTVISIYYDHFTCSNCCQVYNTEQKPTWRFCPNCGSYNGGDES
jgi:hypothetical protein